MGCRFSVNIKEHESCKALCEETVQDKKTHFQYETESSEDQLLVLHTTANAMLQNISYNDYDHTQIPISYAQERKLLILPLDSPKRRSKGAVVELDDIPPYQLALYGRSPLQSPLAHKRRVTFCHSPKRISRRYTTSSKKSRDSDEFNRQYQPGCALDAMHGTTLNE